MSKKVVVIGGGGHARVVIDCIESIGDTGVGILDDFLEAGTLVQNVPVLGKVEDYTGYDDCDVVIGIGKNSIRALYSDMLEGRVNWYTAIHPSAVVSRYATIGEGTVVMPKAVVNAAADVGKHCIINTSAVVEHGNVIEDFAHISPSAALGGTVKVGRMTHVGIGAVVKNNISICEDCVIGAGATVVKDITESGTYVGVPAGRLK